MSRAEHAYELDDLSVLLIVPDGVTAPRFLDVKRGDDVVRLRHAGVRNLRSAVKRKPSQAKPQTPMTANWLPPADEVERARAAAPSVNVDFETAQFVDWALGVGQARADWVASWRGWIRRTHARNVEKGWKPSRTAAPVGETAKEKWLREHGVTAAEYEQRKDDREWVERITRRGKVA